MQKHVPPSFDFAGSFDSRSVSVAIAAIGAASLLSALADLLFPMLLGLSIDRFLSSGLGAESWVLFGATLGVLFLSPALLYLTLKVEASVIPRALSAFRHRAWLNQESSWKRVSLVGDSQRRGSALSSLSLFFEHDLAELLYLASLIILTLLFLAYQSPIITAIAVVAVLVSAVITHFHSARLQDAEQRHQNASGLFLRAFELPSTRKRDFFNTSFRRVFSSAVAEHSKQVDRTLSSLLQVRATLVPVYDITAAIVFSTALLFLLFSVGDTLTAGDAVTLLLALEMFLGGVSKSGRLFSSLYRALTDLQILKGDVETATLASPEMKPSSDALGNGGDGVIFCDVSIVTQEGRPILSDVSCRFPIGSVIALVGPNGSGKTTLLDTMAGLNKLAKGTVSFASTLVPQEDSPLIFYSSQESALLPGDLVDNVLCSRVTPEDRENFMTHLRSFFGLGFLPELPRTFDGWASEESGRLSKGQVHVIALLRAFYSKSPVLLLDEVCSHIDDVRLNTLRMVLGSLRPHGLVFIATHRSELIEVSDYVMRLDGLKASVTAVTK